MKKILTLPTLITLFRLLFVGPFAVYLFLQGNDVGGMGVLLGFFILDKVDGYVARKFKQTSYFGSVLDGTTDTIGLFILISYFYLNRILNAAEVVTIFAPRITYYLIIGILKWKYQQFIETRPWKLSLVVWLMLFGALFISGHNTLIIIIFTAVIYLTLIYHFFITFRKLYRSKESRLIMYHHIFPPKKKNL